MIVELFPLVVGNIALLVASSGKGIKLGQDSSTSVIESTEHLGFLQGRNGGRDRPDERNGFRVDRKVIVQCIIEQGEEMGDLRIDLKETVKRELDFASRCLQVSRNLHS